MKKPVGIVLMVVGLIGVVLGFGYTASSSAGEECERFHQEAIALLEQATAAGEGTPESMALVEEAETKNTFAEISCDHADTMRRDGLVISGIGLLLALVGFVLFRKGKAAAPPV